VAPQLNGLGNLPLPDKGLTYNWQLALNAGEAEILRNIYIQTSDNNKASISVVAKFLVIWQKTSDTIKAAHILNKICIGIIFFILADLNCL
jgi:hypothetical protein